MAPTPIESPEDRLTWEERMVRGAIAAERNRCAKAADDQADYWRNRTDAPYYNEIACAEIIGANIRSGK